MIELSREQKLKRWDILPQNIKEALFSEYNADILWRICQKEHLSEDKISVVAVIAGDILLGFLHPEDAAKEIKESLGVNIEIANIIASEINRKVFSPLKSDLEKIYSPAMTEAETKESEGAEEVLDLRETASEESRTNQSALSWEVVDLKKKEDTPKIIETEKKVLSSSTLAGEEMIDLKKIGIAAEMPLTGPKQIPSAATQDKPFVAGDIEPPVVSEIEPPVVSEIEPPVVSEIEPPVVSEIEPPVVSEIEPPVVSEIEPLIIHKETELKSVSGFSQKRSLGDMFGFLKKKPTGLKIEEPLVVQVEIGQTKSEADSGETVSKTEKKPSEIKPPALSEAKPFILSKTEEPKIRVVHYGGLRTPISPFGKEVIEADKREEAEADLRGKERLKAEERRDAKIETMQIEVPAPLEQKIEPFDAAKTEVLAPAEPKKEPAKKPEEEKSEIKKPESDEEIIDLRKI